MDPLTRAQEGDVVIGVDIGGTFTDAVVVSTDGSTTVGKVLTTPEDFSEGFFGAIADAAQRLELSESQLLSRAKKLAHGTTVGINALVTGSVARVGLVSTLGHGDSVRGHIGQGRIQGASIEEVLDFAASSMPDPVVPRHQVIEIRERLGPQGEVVVPLTDTEMDRVVDELEMLQPEAVALAFLWSFVNPEHEEKVARRISAAFPGLFVSMSHDVAPRIGEYGRTVATVMNAQMGPLMRRYVGRIVDGAATRGFTGEVLFGQGEGGLVPSGQAQRYPVITMHSGPVAGVVGSAIAGGRMGFPNVIVTDMGGTTLDVSTVNGGRVTYREDRVVTRQLVYGRTVDVESIGAGGGSIAWLYEESGTLRVGPQSAGAVPGPICYGRGGSEVTVTDADLVLGILDPNRPLAGGLKLDLEAAEAGIRRLAERLGTDVYECAAGIVQIVDSRMEDLIRRVTVQRGHDPRSCVLFAYGGASGAHAGIYGQGIGVSEVVFPLNKNASVWSAYGLTHLRHTRTFELSTNLRTPFELEQIAGILAGLEGVARRYGQTHGLDDAQCVFTWRADMKYPLQSYTVETDLPDGEVDESWVDRLSGAFRNAYEARFGEGTAYESAGAVITAARVTLEVIDDPIPLPSAVGPMRRGVPYSARDVYWRERGGKVSTPIYLGDDFAPATVAVGPALVEHENTTIAVRPGQQVRSDDYGNMILTLEAGS